MIISNPTVPSLERARGCLVGLAIGDAVGTTLEFCERDTYTHITDMPGGGPFDLEPGKWTDDTSMALCLADSLLEKNGFDPEDINRRFCRWWLEGENSSKDHCFDIGTTTSRALQNFMDSGNHWAGCDDPQSAGNGSIMRLAPIAIYFWRDDQQAKSAARLQSETTHRAAECLDACEYFASLLTESINGCSSKHVFRARQLNLSPSIARIAEGAFKHKDRDAISSKGYVVSTLEAALWAVYNSETFEEAILLAANLGNDADTVAAVVGQLAGALAGMGAIPEHWFEKLYRGAHIQSLATRLYSADQQALKLSS